MKSNINKYSRYQKKLKFDDFIPYRTDGLCRCGCGTKIVPPRRIWATRECFSHILDEYLVIKGNVTHIRKLLYRRDKGICVNCKSKVKEWQADHVIEIRDGGGGCSIDNFQTLCLDCHKKKTKR